MGNDSDTLWNFYQEHCAWERHHEGQRVLVTNILIAIAAGILGVITFDQHLAPIDLPLTIFLILQGSFGALFVAKHYERFARHQRLAKKYREALDCHFPDSKILQLRESADKEHRELSPLLSRLPLHRFWVVLHLLIALSGAALTGIILFSRAG